MLEAGSFGTNHTTVFDVISSAHVYHQKPVVMAAIASANDVDAIVGRI